MDDHPSSIAGIKTTALNVDHLFMACEMINPSGFSVHPKIISIGIWLWILSLPPGTTGLALRYGPAPP